VVDWYAGHLVIGEYTRAQSTPEWLPLMGAAVGEALGVASDKIHLKERRYGKADGKRYERIAYTEKTIVVNERDLKFHVNPWDFVDTGLFSDHRETRSMIRELAAGKDFLNLFCYTATFSCYAAKGGAKSTVSVDRSRTTISWARRNLELNGISEKENRLIQAPAERFLKTAVTRYGRFDVAVVDPPSFSSTRSTEDSFDIAQDHPTLLAAVTEVMRSGGTIVFSTNHQEFTPHFDGLRVSAIEEITARTIPEDYLNKRKTIHRCWKIVV
jgi:23S rRNA (cytosine1962-C5)-methyltransferase